ncbi:glycosyltransferase [Lentzea tibetensis]|uniref:Glycosyltransferase n=1 Tax=Lentzea tibetensis TaxID=2591470 RepID=A0A563EN87_9PSEU|nr:glycosyltransferase family 2 protein [Lentzea tibetensis]TWP48703.1 glycosyltransferase [Lentzea tibetensis]
MTYDVVIPTAGDRRQTLEKCLASVREQHPPPQRIIVVNSGGELDVEGCEVVESPRRSASAQRNLGAAAATADRLVFLDDDVVLEPDTAAQLCAVLSEDVLASGGVVTGAVEFGERTWRSYLHALLGHTHIALRPRERGSVFKASGCVSLVPAPTSPVDTEFLLGGLLACWRKTALDVPFADLCDGYEDLDFSDRVSRIGRMIQTPAAKAHHLDAPMSRDTYQEGFPAAYFHWHAREPGLVGSTWWVVAHLTYALRIRRDAGPYLRGCADTVRRLWREQSW